MTAGEFSPHHPFRSAEARDAYLARYDRAAGDWPGPSESRTVRTDHGETYVRVNGPEDAPPLVLLPGVWANSLMWAPAIPALSAQLRTYAVDNIADFGRSVPSRRISITPDFMSWLDDLLDGLSLKEGVSLLGCSRGTWLAAEYVLHAPERLASAVWLSPPLVVYRPAIGSLYGGALSLAAMTAPSEATVGALIRWLMPDRLRTNRPSFERYVGETALGLRSFDRRLCGRLLGPRLFSDTELSGISVPVLYLAGENEKMSPVSGAVARLHRVAPGIETAVIPSAGHDIPSVGTEPFCDAVLSFLKERARP